MIKQGFLLLLVTVAAYPALGQHSKKNTFKSPSRFSSVASSGPQPYNFGYESEGSSRQESGDATGRVVGSYKVSHEDGSERTVNYVADSDGFRAQVHTDEQGMGPDSPAHVQLKAAPNKVTQFSAPTVQKAPVQMTQFSAPAVQKAPVRVTQFSAPVVQKAPVKATQFSAPAAQKPADVQVPSLFASSGPQPYAFGYESTGSSRQESGDASGRVVGSYRVSNEDGSERTVSYVADGDGFRAQVHTDEQGMGPDSPAHVQLKAAPNKETQYSAPAAQKAPVKVTQFSAPAIKQAPVQVTQFSAPVVKEAPVQTFVPHSFEYTADLGDGSMSRKESADGSGRVVGSYSLSVADGRQRMVDYLADAFGFRASVHSNEFGEVDSPADVRFYNTEGPGSKKMTLYSAPAVHQISTPAVQQHSAPAVQQFSAPAVQRYSAPTIQQLSAPAVQQAPVQSYSYGYRTPLEDGGSSARSESADGSGKVTGSYSLSAADGRRRVVDYSADAEGFRASVETNEVGTKSESPASATYYSSAPETQFSAPPPRMPHQFSAPPALQQAPIEIPHQFSAPPAVQQAPIEVTQFSAPSVQQPLVQTLVQPYAFEYDAGDSARRESADASGTVRGSYDVRNADGSVRTVEYVADRDGFRAKTTETAKRDDVISQQLVE